MAKKYYKTKVVDLGEQVADFSSKAKMLVLFEDSMVFPELRSFAVLHSGNKLDDTIKAGDIIKIADSEFKIIKVGGDVQKNLINLGHVVIKFDDGAGDLMEGSIHVEDKTIPKIRLGDEISINEVSGSILKGKRAAIIGNDNETGKAVSQILVDSGATIVSEAEADIVVKIK